MHRGSRARRRPQGLFLPCVLAILTFYGWHQADQFITAWRAAGFRLAGHLTFPKRYPSAERLLRYQHENAYLLAKGHPARPAQPIPDVLEWKYSGNKSHPTQKPLCVLTPLIQSFSRPGDLVLDPFCGSGSTLLTAQIEHRAFLGIELDPTYFEIRAAPPPPQGGLICKTPRDLLGAFTQHDKP